MKKQFKSLLLIACFIGMAVPVWGQAPSTEGRDFWVTFLRAGYKDGASGQASQEGDPTKLTLTISARKSCVVTIENTSTGLNRRLNINPGNTTIPMINDKNSCYSFQSEQVTNTALHVTSTEEISLFAGNYREKSFDAANIYPTQALMDDYLVQTYPPSAHADSPQGSHFAIIATEDNTIVDYNLTATTAGNRNGAQSTPVLNKGQVYYVWTGKKSGNEADLSGTTVKARDGKKIAVFQGCPHTNLPMGMRDRDHLFSQAMPKAYWGSEFGLTLSRNHRRDIIAVMAINDGTEVYINNEDGDPVLVHTFDFNSTDPQERKHYWTFEIGDIEAYSTHKSSPYTGKLPEPLVADSSCFLTTSCPVGVHTFMVSNTYDEPTSTSSSGSIGDPAMLWISPIEQVIKDINFSTYVDGTDVHFMNILTTTADVPNVEWTDETGAKRSIANQFHPLFGNSDYSYARIQINNGSHNLKGHVGFLAYVYGFGDRCSYAYSCGSSTIQRSVTFNGTPLMIDSVYHGLFCVDEVIDMKLNIGNNDYESIEWDYGDGITYAAPPSATNDEKKQTSHIYSAPGWYDLRVSAVYVNHCTNQRHDEEMHFSFRVVRAETAFGQVDHDCIELDSTLNGVKLSEAEILDLTTNGKSVYREQEHCYDTLFYDFVHYGMKTEEWLDTITGKDQARGHNGKIYYESTDVIDTSYNETNCEHYQHYYVKVLTCVEMNLPPDSNRSVCPGDELSLAYAFRKGSIVDLDAQGNNAILRVKGYPDEFFSIPNRHTQLDNISIPTDQIEKPGKYNGQILVKDEYCNDTVGLPVQFTVNYPEDIFKYKFNNVLAVYKPGYGGNEDYEFTHYEWHLVRDAQDTVLLAGEKASVLYLGEKTTFMKDDQVYVVLTDISGMTLPSCSQIILNVPEYGEDPSNAPQKATKRLVNRQIVIRKGEKDYNIYGQLIE